MVTAAAASIGQSNGNGLPDPDVRHNVQIWGQFPEKVEVTTIDSLLFTLLFHA